VVVHAAKLLTFPALARECFYVLTEQNSWCEIMPQPQNSRDRVVPPEVFRVYLEKRFTCDRFFWGVKCVKGTVNDF
jgi:hypothetical protein